MRMRGAAFLSLVILFADPVAAGHLNDLWWNPSEPGWGVNIIQQEEVLFVTLFVYGADGRPAWYVASEARPGTPSRYTGALYATNGPAASVRVREVGTLALSPNDDGSAALEYSVDGAATSKRIERQTWARIETFTGPMEGFPGAPGMVYSGTVQLASLVNQGCPGPLGGQAPGAQATAFSISTRPTDGVSGTMAITIQVGPAAVWSLSGTYRQRGSSFAASLTSDVAAQPAGYLPPGRYAARVDPLVFDGLFVHGYLRLTGDNGCKATYALAGHGDATTSFVQGAAR